MSLQDPLVSRCGYLRQAILRCGDGDGEVVELPASFPGGSEAFEVIGLYCYGDAVALDPFNVAAVRCAAEFLDVSGLGARCDLYINQVVLQSWDDALIVLQRCQPLLPVAEELLVVSRCVESLAFMACMEILDPDGDEQRRERDQPGLLAAAAAGLAGAGGTPSSSRSSPRATSGSRTSSPSPSSSSGGSCWRCGVRA